MITIVDYGAGNLKSVEKAFNFIGVKTNITSSPKELLEAKAIVLPGVGAFGEAIKKINESGLGDVLQEMVFKNVPLLGICLGLQMLFDFSEEGNAKGLGILKGEVKKFPKEIGLKIPHMGWNQVGIKKDSKLLAGIDDNTNFYFVHSYYLSCKENVVVGKTGYGIEFDSVVEKENIFATQFHPEKSGKDGLKIMANFAKIAEGGVLAC